MTETQIVSNCTKDQNHFNHFSHENKHQSWHENLNKVKNRLNTNIFETVLVIIIGYYVLFCINYK